MKRDERSVLVNRGVIVPPSVVIDREQYRHNDTHQWHEDHYHRPDQSNKEVSIQPALRLELLVPNFKYPAEPFDWARGYRFHSQSVLYKIGLRLTMRALASPRQDSRICTHYILRPIAELLSTKNPAISNANRPKLTAILSTKALVAMPCWLWPLPPALRKLEKVSLVPEVVVLSIPATAVSM